MVDGRIARTRAAGGIATLAALLVFGCRVDARAAEALQFTGTARDLKTDRVLYTEQYDVQVDNGRWVSGVTRYLLPSGQQVAERKFDFSADRYVPLYTLEQSVPEYREGITHIDKGRVDVFMVRDGKRQAASLERVREMVADCGAQGYVVEHLAALQAGAVLHFTLVVSGRTDNFQLRARKVADVDVGGHKAVRVRVELDSVLRLLLPPLELTIDPQSKRLLEYSGITNLKDPATRKAYTARIAFTYR